MRVVIVCIYITDTFVYDSSFCCCCYCCWCCVCTFLLVTSAVTFCWLQFLASRSQEGSWWLRRCQQKPGRRQERKTCESNHRYFLEVYSMLNILRGKRHLDIVCFCSINVLRLYHYLGWVACGRHPEVDEQLPSELRLWKGNWLVECRRGYIRLVGYSLYPLFVISISQDLLVHDGN